MPTEGEEVLGLAFVAAVQASTAGQPGDSSFDNPAVAAEPLRGLDALAGDAVAYAAAAEPSPQVVVAIALVRVQLPGAPAAGPTAGTNGRDSADERFQASAGQWWWLRAQPSQLMGAGPSVAFGSAPIQLPEATAQHPRRPAAPDAAQGCLPW